MRGLVAELHSITDPAERTRFALGAIAALARLALSGYSRATVYALGRFIDGRVLEDGAGSGDASVSQLPTRELLRRHIIPFSLSFVSLTTVLLANYARQQIPRLSDRGVPTAAIIEVLLLGVPFTLMLTIPMAVFLAVSWVFSRLGAEGVLASARSQRHGIRRLIAPVLAASAVVAVLTLVSNTQVVPRTNARLIEVLEGAPRETERALSVGELREAARKAQSAFGSDAAARFEVEIQKKFALAAASVFMALVAAATAIRFPHGGVGLVLGTSCFVFPGYWASLVAGEALAEGQVISPFLAMWMANAFLLSVVVLLAWRPGHPDHTNGAGTLAIEV